MKMEVFTNCLGQPHLKVQEQVKLAQVVTMETYRVLQLPVSA